MAFLVLLDCNFCQTCNRDKIRQKVADTLDRLVKCSTSSEDYARGIFVGKCKRVLEAVDIERYRRGWEYSCIEGCPDYVYKELRYERGLPPRTTEALREYERLHPEVCTRQLSATIESQSALGVFVENSKVWVSSKDVAIAFEKEHKNVLRDIKCLECSDTFNALNFELVEYLDAKGESRPEYFMTRDGFTFLAMGFRGAKAAKFKELYISEFNRMEKELLKRSYPQQETCLLPSDTRLSQREARALSTAAAARRSEQAMKRRLNKALDIIAERANRP